MEFLSPRVKVGKANLISTSQGQKGRRQRWPRMLSRLLLVSHFVNYFKENHCVSNHGICKTLAFRKECWGKWIYPKSSFKIQTSCNYDIILCSKLGIAHCFYVWLKPCPTLGESRTRWPLSTCLRLKPDTFIALGPEQWRGHHHPLEDTQSPTALVQCRFCLP